MAAITTYDLLNTRIDLGDALSWRRAQAPNFIRLFGAPVTTEVDGQGNPIPVVATATEHWRLEGVVITKLCLQKPRRLKRLRIRTASGLLRSIRSRGGSRATSSISWATRRFCAFRRSTAKPESASRRSKRRTEATFNSILTRRAAAERSFSTRARFAKIRTTARICSSSPGANRTLPIFRGDVGNASGATVKRCCVTS